MPASIKATTNISVKTNASRTPAQLYGQVYKFSEEGISNVTRKVEADQVEEIIVVPDTDIQSSIKFVHISAEGEVSDLAAARVALSVRKYDTPKSAVSSGDTISSFTDPTYVFGAMSGERVGGDKSLASEISIKGGAIGIILAKDSDGVATDYPNNNALPLTLKVDNHGTAPINVKIKAIYDPSPADHKGSL
jgi:hypothetical protein